MSAWRCGGVQGGRRGAGARNGNNAHSGDEEDGDLFRVRATADGGAAPDLARRAAGDDAGDDAEDALDASCLAPAELDLARWQSEGAAEALRDRFVTGESIEAIIPSSCLPC